MNEPFVDLLASEAMPALAEALRTRRERVVQRWNEYVCATLPEADELTVAQVRNSIPRVLEQMVAALESSEESQTRLLLDMSRSHGAVRFHESYNVKEVIIEYRILRRVLFEEMEEALQGRVSTREWMALDIAVDLSMQQAVITFIENQKEQLKSSTEAEAKFLSFLAHDLRNSLNSILLTMQWVESSVGRYGELREEREGLHSARDEATRTIDSMERLLQAERLRKGVQARREEVNLAALAERALAEARRAVAGAGGSERRLEFENRVAPEAVLTSDAGLLALILQNLLGNAVKYSEQGRITVEAQHIEDGRGQGWMVSVRDQGRGIAREQLAKLFNAFTRGETHGQPGVGLGLFIASQAARLLGSRLEVESEVGKGTSFSFLLRSLPAPDAV